MNDLDARARGGRPGRGLLVGLRRLRFLRRPRIGEQIEFQVELLRRLAPLTLVRGRAAGGGELVAEGELKFWVEPQP
jgi:3-hydroxymyristoyl/3-hydroxydecanoyl-(acyl carrier protein) dehydratase